MHESAAHGNAHSSIHQHCFWVLKKNLIKISMLLWNFKVCAMITKQIPLLYRYSYLLLFCIKSLHLFSTWIYKNEFKN